MSGALVDAGRLTPTPRRCPHPSSSGNSTMARPDTTGRPRACCAPWRRACRSPSMRCPLARPAFRSGRV
ncbi:MAG: hypothetical protein ACK56I_31695, partial [bacterium]